MGVNTATTVSAIITRETTFSDFLFVLWYIVSLWKMDLLLKERICTCGANSFLQGKIFINKGYKNIFESVSSPEGVSISHKIV